MKKTAWYCGALVLAVLNAVYLALTADSFYLEYVKDEFVYWGYPQWGWMYSDPKIYLWFNVLYLAFLLLLFAAGLFLIGKKRLKTGTALLLLPLLTAAAFLYMPTYNWNRQFAVFNAERTNENSRIPEGKWWVSLDQMQRYSLLVLDDLGAERDTAYAAEQVFNVVDARVQTGLPLIVTTNLSVAEMQQADSMQLKRIYDRVLELCPVRIKLEGESRRTQNAQQRLTIANDLLRPPLRT